MDQAHAQFQRLLRIARRDDDILAFWLDGSRGKGLATAHSDCDCTLIVTESALADACRRFADPASAGFDLTVMTLAQFRDHAAWGGPQAWNRYNFAHLSPLVDKTGLIAGLMAEKARVPPEALDAFIAQSLDHVINQTWRSLKARRDGLASAARLEAAEGVTPLLDAIFALHDARLRPYGKYLEWELATHPLQRLPWPPAAFVILLLRVLTTADTAAQRILLRGLESLARDAGHGAVFDAWGSALGWMRGE